VSARQPDYDRGRAAGILHNLAPTDLPHAGAVSAGRITFVTTPLAWEPGHRLTLPQHLYLQRSMHPATEADATSATHRLTWTDSGGIVNTGYIGPSGLGPIMPIAVREAVLTLSASVTHDPDLTAATSALSEQDRATLAATTTDHDPAEIIRTGIEAAGRALAQHALIADQAGHTDPAAFARAMRDSGLFATVAGTWFWGLQAGTYRRGLVPVRLTGDGGHGDRLRYPAGSLTLLAAMKRATVGRAHEVMDRATGAEGLTVAQALHRYDIDLDQIPTQYALLDHGAHPRCLALMTPTGPGSTMFDRTVAALVDTVVRVLADIEVVETESPGVAVVSGSRPNPVFSVPDMVCRHCRITITAALEAHGAEVADVDLITKRVTAVFETSAQREAVFTAIRAAGYTVIDTPPDTDHEE
jgi:copper chaperone CopZ